MFKVKYVDYMMMLVRLDLNLIVSLFQHKCEVSTTTLVVTIVKESTKIRQNQEKDFFESLGVVRINELQQSQRGFLITFDGIYFLRRST